MHKGKSMHNSNNSRYLVVSALFLFASIKEIYAESEMVNATNSTVETNLSIAHSTRQEELLIELLSAPYEEQPAEELTPEACPEETTTIQESLTTEEQEQLVNALVNSLNLHQQEPADEPSPVANPETVTPVQESLTTEQQEQLISMLISSLNAEEKEQFIKLLEEAVLLTENNKEKTKEEQEESLQQIFKAFNASRCVGFCIKLVLAIISWDFIAPLITKNSKPEGSGYADQLFTNSPTEMFKTVVGTFLHDDIKDFFKEIKKAGEASYRLVFQSIFPSTKTI